MKGAPLYGSARKTNFPHYPQSYPQKQGLKPRFYRASGNRMWITWTEFQLIHSVLHIVSAFVHNFSRAFSTKNVKIICKKYYENEINTFLTVWKYKPDSTSARLGEEWAVPVRYNTGTKNRFLFPRKTGADSRFFVPFRGWKPWDDKREDFML